MNKHEIDILTSDKSISKKKTYVNDNQLLNLQTFVCVAKNLSFTLAADELYISPSAVSHRIAKLEHQLGFELFYRFTRMIKLTEKGERLFDILSHVFNKINNEISEIQSNELSGALTILSHPSIANDWLIPKLASFRENYPHIQLNIKTGNETVNFQTNTIDLALYYSDGIFPGMNCEKLMDEEIFPVCSIAYAEKYQLIDNPNNLQFCTLLHDAKAWHFSAMDAEWLIWCRHYSLPIPEDANSISFDSSKSALLAAEYHAGIAMGRKKIVSQRIKNKKLIYPFNLPPLKTNYNYYLVWPRLQKIPLRLKVFIDWIKNQSE